MKIGFPVIDKNKFCSFVICEISRSDNPVILAKEDDRNETLTCQAFLGNYQGAPNQLVGHGFTLAIEIKHSSLEATRLLSAKKPNSLIVLNIAGNSGTLAFFVLQELREQIADSTLNETVLFSGVLLKHLQQISLTGLDVGVSDDLIHKATGCRGTNLWLLKSDFDSLTETIRSGIVPFLAPHKSPEWLIHEVCEKYDLAIPMSYLPLKKLLTAGALTEKDLCIAAIGDLGNEPGLAERFEQYFVENPPRELLPVQRAALEPKNEGLFSNDMDATLRHVLISGPTGCGKTTLMHSLLLNAMHNRSGGALYVGPVKALVEEFFTHVTEELELLRPTNLGRRIVISTGDYWKDDAWISRGDFGLACMVYEKASILFTAEQSENFLSGISLLIVDELHMLQDPTRGDVVDVLIAKCLKENLRRGNANLPLIQLALISTESVTDNIKGLTHFKTDAVGGGILEPIVISSEVRDPVIKHRVGIVSAHRKPHFVSREICDFSHNNHRKLLRPAINELRASVRTPTIQYGDADKKKNTNNIYVDAVLDLIHEEFHHTIIVACNSIPRCHELAGLLTSRLIHNLDARRHQDPDLVEEINQSGLAPSVIRDIKKWRMSGVFVHHGQLPAKLRISTSLIFREKIQANSRPKVLFTTETLTYGVNLSASCVVLIDRQFKRENPVNPKTQPVDTDMSPNQYHNLLGRAGRKGYEKVRKGSDSDVQQTPMASALVMIDEKEFLDGSDFVKFLAKYYGLQSSPALLSSIAHSKDWKRFKNNIDQPDFKLTELSFSIFRTTLECVRTAGSNASFEKILHVFKLTLGYQTAPENMQPILERLFGAAFQKCTTYGEEQDFLRLVESHNALYTIKHTANALIDTGTSLHSLEPIAVWLKVMVGETNLPPEALIPGIIAAPEFTRVACELFGDDVFHLSQDADNVKSERVSAARRLAHIQLSKIFLSDTEKFLEKIDSFFDSFAVTYAMTIVPDRTNKQVVAYRLLAVICSWISGASDEQIKKIFLVFERRSSSSWLPKHSDRLQQLVNMTYRFFSKGEGYLSPRLKLELPQLAIRMKHGVPFLASPYINVVGTDGVLPRATVNFLYSKIPDSFSLLNESLQAQNAELLSSCLLQIPGNNKTSDDVITVVRRAYTEGLEYFVSKLMSNEVKESCMQALSAMRANDGGAIFANSWRSKRLLMCLGQNPNLQDDLDPDGVIPALFDCLYTVESPDLSHIYLLNWHDVTPQNIWSVTPCAFVLIQMLMRRRLLAADTLAFAMQSVTPQKINVHWVASELWLDSSLRDMTSLRESMLSFLEPENLSHA